MFMGKNDNEMRVIDFCGGGSSVGIIYSLSTGVFVSILGWLDAKME